MTFNFIYKYAKDLKPEDKYEIYEGDRLKEIIIRKLINQTKSQSTYEITTEGGTSELTLYNFQKLKVIKDIAIPSMVPEGKIASYPRSRKVNGRSID